MATFFKYTYMYCKIKFCVVLRSMNTYVYTVVCTNIFGKHETLCQANISS